MSKRRTKYQTSILNELTPILGAPFAIEDMDKYGLEERVYLWKAKLESKVRKTHELLIGADKARDLGLKVYFLRLMNKDWRGKYSTGYACKQNDTQLLGLSVWIPRDKQ